MFTESYISEIWKPVVGYEGWYEVSNFGRVRSLEKTIRQGNGYGLHNLPIRILNGSKDKDGYLRITFTKNGKKKTVKVHRLVAEAFIPNPNDYPCVNHRDENVLNNRVENLEWCSVKYNSNYGTRNKRLSKTKCKTILQFTIDGEFIREYTSLTEAVKQTRISSGNISSCCNGKRKSPGVRGGAKYIWRYKGDIL